MVLLNDFNDLREVLLRSFARYDKVGLITHKNPDGDGLCCCLALQEFILNNYRDENKTRVDVILEAPPPQNYNFLGAPHRTVTYSDELNYQLVVLLDCQSPERTGKCSSLPAKAEEVIVIDHHQPEDNEARADSINSNVYYYNNPQCASTGIIINEALADDFATLPQVSHKYVAENIYITILNDTNHFTNSNTDVLVFKTCAALMRAGISPNAIVKQFVETKGASYYRFLGQAMATITSHFDDKVVFFYSLQRMLEENKLTGEATVKMTDNLRNLSPQTDVLVYFREIGEQRFKLSLRAATVNVNKIAARYGGGGHLRASGCEMEGELHTIQQKILKEIGQQLNR